MNGFIRFMIVAAMIASLTSCASRPAQDDLSLDDTMDSSAGADLSLDDSGGDGSDVVADDSSASSAEATPSESGATDEFADFDNSPEDQAHQAGQTQPQSGNLEDEFDQAEGSTPQQASQEPVAPADAGPVEMPPIVDTETGAPQVADVPEQPPMEEPAAPAQEIPQTQPSTPVAANQSAPATITDLQFKANDNGGTIIVQGNRPLTFTTRSNPDLHQYIVEVDNAILPDRLKRSLNTKDIRGAVGAIDAYQNPGSTKARIVVQLREGVSEPAVQNEGNAVLIVAAGSAPTSVASGPQSAPADDTNAIAGDGKILPNQNLTEFLTGNTQFYGKKISIETSNMDIRDALNFITEESGVNMVISDDVKGAVSLKLRQVPWDQALVVLMRARKLGYTRQGNVLRIAQLNDLRTEEDDAAKLALARKNTEPLKVRMFNISYARVEDLEKKLKDFLGERGRVVGDPRTNSVVVTDIAENLDRAAKLILSLDTQPPQVLIEGKIVEASERFTRSVGVNWNVSGQAISLGNTQRGPVNMTPRFNINPAMAQGGNFNFNVDVGTLDIFGSISAALSLSEAESKVKTLSSPRIMTMSNEPAYITQTTEVPVRQVTITGNSSQVTYQFKPLSLRLDVTPQVTADGSVMMKVKVARQVQGATQADGSFSTNTREADTRVLVKNGQTAVIGGIYVSDATEGDEGVPWLREIPFIGNLFKLQNSSKEKSELLVFLTPRVTGQFGANAAQVNGMSAQNN
ncbi:type IV pilus secretin PilQ [Bdellovibrio sp. SKB1291214]|uniref:type IV pilus secretin PilQ n=1 Tax=Bdellovibrio sp. SKB1291214 TaxID=1732569 RepID=UPI0020CDC269|nr:type IV pilus secretin PilQ [Bdellovibrio sp. SKB1291214]UYL08962.1 type IV pilus secretin PilQ [Bdellovibrio sp. SKB1291214]